MPQRQWIEHSGDLAAGVFTLSDNPSRRAVIIANHSDLKMMYRVGAEAADATHGVPLEADKAIALDGGLCPDGDVTLWGEGLGNSPATSQLYTVYEVVG